MLLKLFFVWFVWFIDWQNRDSSDVVEETFDVHWQAHGCCWQGVEGQFSGGPTLRVVCSWNAFLLTSRTQRPIAGRRFVGLCRMRSSPKMRATVNARVQHWAGVLEWLIETPKLDISFHNNANGRVAMNASLTELESVSLWWTKHLSWPWMGCDSMIRFYLSCQCTRTRSSVCLTDQSMLVGRHCSESSWSDLRSANFLLQLQQWCVPLRNQGVSFDFPFFVQPTDSQSNLANQRLVLGDAVEKSPKKFNRPIFEAQPSHCRTW